MNAQVQILAQHTHNDRPFVRVLLTPAHERVERRLPLASALALHVDPDITSECPLSCFHLCGHPVVQAALYPDLVAVLEPRGVLHFGDHDEGVLLFRRVGAVGFCVCSQTKR